MTYLYKPQHYYLPASISLAAENGRAALDAALPAALVATAPESSKLDDVLVSAAKAMVSFPRLPL